MQILRNFLSVSMMALQFISCSKNEEVVVEPPPDNNLIANSSFEFNGVASLQGWKANTNDTSFIGFSSDVPQQGGNFSIRLRNEWSFPGRISWDAILPPGLHRYHLSAWAKTVASRPRLMSGGFMGVYVKDSSALRFRKSVAFFDTVWTNITLLDTLKASSSDTLMVVLNGNGTQFSFGYVLFDLCRLKKLD